MTEREGGKEGGRPREREAKDKDQTHGRKSMHETLRKAFLSLFSKRKKDKRWKARGRNDETPSEPKKHQKRKMKNNTKKTQVGIERQNECLLMGEGDRERECE